MRLAWVELLRELQTESPTENIERLLAILENIRSLCEEYRLESDIKDNINSCITQLSETQTASSITALKQLLQTQIQEAIIQQPRLVMFNQAWLLDHMKTLGYKIAQKGICYGLSYMTIAAFLANDMETFHQRLHVIHDIPKADCADDFALIRARIQRYQETGRNEKARLLQANLIDIRAFFDGIALTQMPMLYHFGAEDIVSDQQSIEQTQPFILSSRFEHEENLRPTCITKFSGIYLKHELEIYLTLLKKYLGQHDFALQLRAFDHVIALTYDSTTQRWLLTDPNYLPGEEYIDTQHLTNALFNQFNRLVHLTPMATDNMAMSTQIITHQMNAASLQRHYESLLIDKDWESLHEAVNIDHRDLTDNTPRSAYEKAFVNRLEEQEIVHYASQAGQDEILELLLKKHAYDFFSISIIEPEQKKTFNMLCTESKINAYHCTQTKSNKQKLILWDSTGALFQSLPLTEQTDLFLSLEIIDQSLFIFNNIHEDRLRQQLFDAIHPPTRRAFRECCEQHLFFLVSNEERLQMLHEKSYQLKEKHLIIGKTLHTNFLRQLNQQLQLSESSIWKENKYSMKEMLRFLSIEQCRQLLNALQPDLAHFFTTTNDVAEVLSIDPRKKNLSSEQRTLVLSSIQNELPRLCATGSDVAKVLRHLSSDQCMMVLVAIQNELARICATTIDLQNVLDYLSPLQKILVLNAIEDKLPEMCASGQDVAILLYNVPLDQRTRIFDRLKNTRLVTLMETKPAEQECWMRFLLPTQRDELQALFVTQCKSPKNDPPTPSIK